VNMSDAQSAMSGEDEASIMSENDDKGAVTEPIKAPGVFHAPTTQELARLREGSELFKSNSFKLQVSQRFTVLHLTPIDLIGL
jgi:hypothetical protein